MRLIVVFAFLAGIGLLYGGQGRAGLNRVDAAETPGKPAVALTADVDRSPVDLLLNRAETHLLSLNQTSGTLSLLRWPSGEIVTEVPCGERPSALAVTPDERAILVTGTYSGTLQRFQWDGDRLTPAGSLTLRFEPRGVVVAPDGKVAYVALTTAGAVAVVDLVDFKEVARIPVGRWPRYMAISPDGSRLAVGLNGAGGVGVVDTQDRKLLYTETFTGLNMGQMEVSPDGKFVYFPFMVYRRNPITPNNIRLGWVLASRLARVRLDGKARRDAIALDPQGQAVSDPHGLALHPAGEWVVSAASGTHELLIFRLPGLPFQDYGGPGDHIDAQLLKDTSRFARVPLGGRPMAVRFTRDGRSVLVANYLLNAIQVVDLNERKLVRTLPVGRAKTQSLARRGEAIFYDGQRSLDQWYSCHSCHYEGHANAEMMDTRNDGRFGNFKVVLSLRHVSKTGPWFWHGWQEDYATALKKSLTDSMLGPVPTAEDVQALQAFLETLKPPPNPYRQPDGSLTEAAQRGEKVFRSEKAGCSRCHSGPYFTDGRIHDVGTNARGDVYSGYNPPTLLGVYDRLLYLHDGRAATLEQLLKGPHHPDQVNARGDLTDQELADLLEYLKSL